MKYGILDYQKESSIEERIVDGEIICYGCRAEDELPDNIAQLDAVSLWHDITLSEKTITRLERCKAIVRIGVGFDSVDIQSAGRLGIPVLNIPDYGTNDVADHAFALLLSLVRKIPLYQKRLVQSTQMNWIPAIGGEIHRLTDQVMGIVGMGRIGTAVARRAQAFGMKVIFYDPYLPRGFEKTYQCRRADSLEELLIVADVVSLHTPLTEQTQGMINEQRLKNAKRGMLLINTSRGGVVKNDAVYYALRTGILRGFAADVLEQEPPCNADALIRAFMGKENGLEDHILLTPHAAFFAQESQAEMREKSAIQMYRAANGLSVMNCVNKEYLINPRIKV